MRVTALVLVLLAAAAPRGQSVRAADDVATPPMLAITVGTEEGKKVLIATITREGRPLEGVKVAFFAERTFGLLALGEESTLDDGTAAVPFPLALPGGPTGELRLRALVTSPPEYAAVRGVATLPGGVVMPAQEEPFPRALWAPRAPVPLLLTLGVLLLGVWSTYFYVLVQLFKIRGGSRP